ncbi:GH25 family lysozyme [Lacticaseibacillus absianus]|uniref:GH25 family lysozyme n=1 Tax=Lacticaseibacillus absianus TaxID=2729623 RepID=UPI0015CE0C93|nr:GH25 family lysozyme [Lacticaseibacillus absianus]
MIGAGGWGWHVYQTQHRGAARYPVQGVVLTQADGYQDFGALHAAGVDFAYLKATEGASYFDDDFTPNYDRGIGTPVRIGVYHYFSFDSTPSAQAAHFLTKVGRDLGTLPIGIYLTYYGRYADEPPAPAKWRPALQTFITTIQRATGKRVVLMGSQSLLKQCSTVAPDAPRWVIGATRWPSADYWQDGVKRFGGYTAVAFTGTVAAFAQQ